MTTTEVDTFKDNTCVDQTGQKVTLSHKVFCNHERKGFLISVGQGENNGYQQIPVLLP